RASRPCRVLRASVPLCLCGKTHPFRINAATSLLRTEWSWQGGSVSKIVGIDLGTTNSLVATVDSGIPLVIADAEGRRLTPSVVHFPAPGADAIVGDAANRVRVIRPADTAYSVKRFIGRR